MKPHNGQLLWFDGMSEERWNAARYNEWGKGEPGGKDCAYVLVQQYWNDGQCDYNPGKAPSVLCQKARL